MKKTIRKKKRKVNKVKAGFVPGNVLLILMFSGLSFGCFSDITSTIKSILNYQNQYEMATKIRDEKQNVVNELKSMEMKLKDYEFLESYIRASLLLTKEGETVFIIQGNE